MRNMYAKLSDITKKITHFSLRLKIYYFNTLLEKKLIFNFLGKLIYSFT